jgi:hypothetical protein
LQSRILQAAPISSGQRRTPKEGKSIPQEKTYSQRPSIAHAETFWDNPILLSFPYLLSYRFGCLLPQTSLLPVTKNLRHYDRKLLPNATRFLAIFFHPTPCRVGSGLAIQQFYPLWVSGGETEEILNFRGKIAGGFPPASSGVEAEE